MSKVFAGDVTRLLGACRRHKAAGARVCAEPPFLGPGGGSRARPGQEVSDLVQDHVPALYAECDLSGSCDSLADISSCSAVKQDLSEVQELLDSGASLDEEDESGMTLLFHACDCGYLELVQALVLGGATIDLSCGPHDRTPLQQAAFHGYQSVVKYLIEKGASATATDRDGHTALSLANASSHSDVVKVLSYAG